jgi:hypothetical protein
VPKLGEFARNWASCSNLWIIPEVGSNEKNESEEPTGISEPLVAPNISPFSTAIFCTWNSSGSITDPAFDCRFPITDISGISSKNQRK